MFVDIIYIRNTCFSMFFFKTVFSSFKQTFDIASVTVDRNSGNRTEKDQYRRTFGSGISDIDQTENIRKDRQSGSCGNTGN